MPVDIRVTLEKMLKHCKNASKYAEGISYEEFIQNELFLTFTVFSLSQLGELATVLSNRTECCEQYPQLPWIGAYTDVRKVSPPVKEFSSSSATA